MKNKKKHLQTERTSSGTPAGWGTPSAAAVGCHWLLAAQCPQCAPIAQVVPASPFTKGGLRGVEFLTIYAQGSGWTCRRWSNRRPRQCGNAAFAILP